MVKAPSIKMQLYLFEGLLFKESILSGQIRRSEAITKLLNFLHKGLENRTRIIRSCMDATETHVHVIKGTTI